MASRNNIDRLKQIPPESGRIILEDGLEINKANALIDEFYAKASTMASAGRQFFTSDTTQVVAGGSTTYTLRTSSSKYVIQYVRDLKVTGNLWDIEVLVGGTVSGGTPLLIQNSILDIPYTGDTEFLTGTTVTGATIGATDFISAPGLNKTGGASGTGGGNIIIYPPNGEFSVRNTNTGNTTQRVHLDYSFSEITIEELERLKGIYVI